MRYRVEHNEQEEFDLIHSLKKTRYHLFIALNRANDVSAADWRPQIHVKSSSFFKCGETAFLSGGNIKHSSLYNKEK